MASSDFWLLRSDYAQSHVAVVALLLKCTESAGNHFSGCGQGLPCFISLGVVAKQLSPDIFLGFW